MSEVRGSFEVNKSSVVVGYLEVSEVWQVPQSDGGRITRSEG